MFFNFLQKWKFLNLAFCKVLSFNKVLLSEGRNLKLYNNNFFTNCPLISKLIHSCQSKRIDSQNRLLEILKIINMELYGKTEISSYVWRERKIKRFHNFFGNLKYKGIVLFLFSLNFDQITNLSHRL